MMYSSGTEKKTPLYYGKFLVVQLASLGITQVTEVSLSIVLSTYCLKKYELFRRNIR